MMPQRTLCVLLVFLIIGQIIESGQCLDIPLHQNFNPETLKELEPGAPVILPGQCDENIQVVQNFDAKKFLGVWHEISSYKSENSLNLCARAEYKEGADGILVENSQVVNRELLTVSGTARVVSNDGSARLSVDINVEGSASSPATYWILDTDYESFSLVYSCRNINPDQRRVWAWKLSRERSLSENAQSRIAEVIQRVNVLQEKYFEPILHTDEACFYYPTPNGKPVVFRGQCDQNVNVVPDFKPEEYTGVWYDIESYPQSEQDGTCPTADYDLSEGVVHVLNTEVRAQQLREASATARLAGAPGEARLIVTFPVPGTGQTVPYWVLDTDYKNYSLVYSCTNIDKEHRRVTSWKLSRTKSLSPEAEAAINAAMARVPVLRQQYYVERGHSEEDCFYYPDNRGGPVVLRGQCAPPEQVKAVANFDAEKFSGTWYEYARFPSELQIGECGAKHYDFDPETGEFGVKVTIVDKDVDFGLCVITGSATAADDGRGVLAHTMVPEENVYLRGTIYIMDVEYDDFALMYGCKNLNSTFLQVYSWKMTRDKEALSAEAKRRIDAVVSREENLFEGYYEVWPRDDDACFYYPDFGPDLPEVITLPGPCPADIRGVPDFKLDQYMNSWYEIEKYPQPFQTGDCSRATYTNTGSAVAVLNTQVVDQLLKTQKGTAVAKSSDGFGEFKVTFDVGGVTNEANYYVLATDYTDYALVYSCRAAEGNRQQVAFWKLSRNPALSENADTEINKMIATTQGLRQEYFTITNQTQEACFYVPEPVPNKDVLLRGACDQCRN